MQHQNKENVLTFRIFILGYAVLFLELLLIRWISTEVGVLAYLQNSVLVVCFLALGMGLLKEKQFERHTAKDVLLWFLLLILLLSTPYFQSLWLKASTLLSYFHDFEVWTSMGSVHFEGVALWALILLSLAGVGILLGVVWQIMMPLGSLLGHYIDIHPRPLRAYSADILGGCLGGLTFALFGWAALSPVAWVFFGMLLILQLMLLYSDSPPKVHGSSHFAPIIPLALILSIILVYQGYGHDGSRNWTIWTPYQKLTVHPSGLTGEYDINANNVGFQKILNNSAEGFRLKNAEASIGRSQYDLPARFNPEAQSIVVFGSGTGNDVAGLLRHTQSPIVAVEIDPGVSALGRQLHPEHPFQNQLVTIVDNDARSYLAQAATSSVDLMVFGLLDSHTTPHLTSSRIDNFVYTEESFREIHRVLRPTGVLFMLFMPQRDYVLARLKRGIDTVFQTPTRMIGFHTTPVSWGGVALINGSQQRIDQSIAADPVLQETISTSGISAQTEHIDAFRESFEIINDNWPFLYIERPTIPVLFVFLCILVGFLWIRTSRQLGDEMISPDFRDSSQLIFFAMGAAFMLIQSFLLSRVAAVLGSTWFVNSVVISGMLMTIVVANFIVEYCNSRALFVTALLILVCVCISFAFLPVRLLHSLPFSMRIVSCAFLAGIPSFLSGIAFGTLISNTPSRSTALGANLFGAMIGGMMQYLCFLFGFGILALLAGLMYGVTLLASFGLPSQRALEASSDLI